MNVVLAALAAVAIGAVLGLLGAGGSIMTTPLLVYLLGMAPHAATTLSLVVVGTTSATAALLHGRAGHVKLRIALPFALAGAPGAFVGGRLAGRLDGDSLMLGFAGFMAAAAIALLLRRDAPGAGVGATPGPHERDAPRAPGPLATALAGLALGLLTGLLGAGGGFLIVPTLVLLFRLPMRDAIGTSLVVIAANAAVGLAARAYRESLDLRLATLLSVVAIAGAVLGHRLSGRVPQVALRKGFAVLVLTVAAFIAVRTVGGLLHGG